jgi:hypothetical protein
MDKGKAQFGFLSEFLKFNLADAGEEGKLTKQFAVSAVTVFKGIKLS